MPVEIAPGVNVNTVADIIGDHGQAAEVPVSVVCPPIVEGCPAFPEPGIYFGMNEDIYHSIHAASASGLKMMAASATNYWYNSPLNTEREDEDTTFKALGRAYHCRICEGPTAFAERYAMELDQADFEGLDQKLCVTVADIRAAIEECGGKPKGTKKEDLIALLHEFDPTWPVWDVLVRDHAGKHEGKVLISPKQVKRIEIAARMIESDPQLKDAFTGGHPEVSVFFYDPTTGVPCKARFDFLKLNALVDLKSVGNPQNKPIQRAIDAAISNNKYYLAVVFYLRAIEAVKALVKQEKGACVFGPEDRLAELKKWSWTWAHQPEPECLWVFQQTNYPVTRGRRMRKGTTFEVTRFAVDQLLRKWRMMAETYGTDVWLDLEPIVDTVDEELGWAATDYGEIIHEG